MPKRQKSKWSIFPNAKALELSRRLVACRSMLEATAALRAVAATLPDTGPKGWAACMRRLADDLDAGRTTYAIFNNGNMKLDFASWSVLPIVTCPGAGECAKWCYSLKAWRTPGGFLRQVQNTLLTMFNRRPIIEAFKALPEGITLRLFVDGDFADAGVLQFWFNLLKQRPDLDCYGYSKSWELFVEWHDAGREFPANYCVNVSSGSRYGADMEARMLSLPVTRERFVAVPIPHQFMLKKKGYSRYDDPAYHRAVRESAAALGFLKVLSCSGKCFACVKHNGENAHACGGRKDDGSFVFGGVVAIGCH